MNANELADGLEDDYWDSRANKIMLESAKMLRQQQAEIKALKSEIIEWIGDSPYNINPDEYFKSILRKAQEK